MQGAREHTQPKRVEGKSTHLFLGVGSLLLLVLLALLAAALVAGLAAGVAQSSVGVLGGLVVGDLALLEDGLVGDGEVLAGERDLATLRDLLGSVDLGRGSVALLGLLGVAREDDETLLVGLQAGHVGLEALLAEVLTARVDSNADSGRKLAGNASLLLGLVSVIHILRCSCFS